MAKLESLEMRYRFCCWFNGEKVKNFEEGDAGIAEDAMRAHRKIHKETHLNCRCKSDRREAYLLCFLVALIIIIIMFVCFLGVGYFRCLKVMEILKASGEGSKNIFGQYSSRKMKVNPRLTY